MDSTAGLGVDLVEIKKAASIYKTHRNQLDSFLGPEEIRYVRSRASKAKALATVLASKEAVFKSLSLPWMGWRGFKNIQMIPGANETFAVRLQGEFHRQRPLSKVPKISVFECNEYVAARCVLEKE